MSQDTITKLMENIEHHMGTAGKGIVRGLLAACAAVVLVWMMIIRIAPAKVSIPGLEFDLPTPFGALALLLTSTVFGIVSAARVWKVRRLEHNLFVGFASAPDDERNEFLHARLTAVTKRSPLFGPLALFGTIFCLYLFHSMYFFLMLILGGADQDLNAPWLFRNVWGRTYFSCQIAFVTVAPFWFLYLALFRLLPGDR